MSEDVPELDVGNSLHGGSNLGSPTQELTTIRELKSGYASDTDSEHDSEATGILLDLTPPSTP